MVLGDFLISLIVALVLIATLFGAFTGRSIRSRWPTFLASRPRRAEARDLDVAFSIGAVFWVLVTIAVAAIAMSYLLRPAMAVAGDQLSGLIVET